MQSPPSKIADRLALAAVVIVSLAAVACSLLAPGFLIDNTVVYGAF